MGIILHDLCSRKLFDLDLMCLCRVDYCSREHVLLPEFHVSQFVSSQERVVVLFVSLSVFIPLVVLGRNRMLFLPLRESRSLQLLAAKPESATG